MPIIAASGIVYTRSPYGALRAEPRPSLEFALKEQYVSVRCARNRLATVMCGYALAGVIPAMADDMSRRTLEGLSAIAVAVDFTADADAKQYAPAPEQLISDAERRLGRSAIKVWKSRVSGPGTLQIAASTTCARIMCAYAVRVELTQGVLLPMARRDAFAIVTTWHTGSIEMRRKEDARAGILALAGRGVDEFIKDYLAVNPK
jgi:hypothetical protein